MLKLRWTEPVDVNVRIFFANVSQKIEIPLERQFRMMPALHQDLNTARGGQFLKFFIDLLEREHVMIFIAFRAIKCAELAVNIADVRVIDVPIDNVCDDLATAIAVAFRLRQIAPCIRQHTEFFQRPLVQLERIFKRNSFAREDFFRQRVSI